MASGYSLQTEPEIDRLEGTRGRSITLVSLAAAVVIGECLIFLGTEEGSVAYFFNALCFPLFPLIAGLKCLHTARSLDGAGRRAWRFFALGCFILAAAEASWEYLDFLFDELTPASSPADIGYILAPICFIVGMWQYQKRTRVGGVSLVQAGNLGIVFSSVMFGYLIILFLILESEALSFADAFMASAEGISFLAAPAIGLTVISLHLWGRRRAIAGLIVAGLACLSIEYFTFIYFLVNGTDVETNPLSGLYLLASAIWFFAATEQDRLEPQTLDAEASAEVEERAKQWETLIPALAVAGVSAAALVFRATLSEEMLPYLSVILLLFVSSLAVRNWWGQRVETTLRAEALAGEALVRRANDNLQLEVETRTRAEEELRQSQKMEALGQLTGGVAHDFNNLLAVIQANLELARLSSGLPDAAARQIANAMDAVGHGASLTQYLLALSRKQALDPQPIDVVELLTQARKGLERTLGKAIKVKISARGDTWPCLADRAQLEAAVLNLALNARDAMPDGGEVSIGAMNMVLDEAHAGVSAGSYVVIAVRDSGVGITEDHLAKVWEPFFTTKKTGEGTGLGLSTVYGFAKQSGGHVEIDSDVGVGTEVRIYLPKSDLSVARGGKQRPEGTPLGEGETLLVVEDETELRDLLAELLVGLNYRVLSAAGGSEALSVLDEVPEIRMVLTDVMLVGGMNGVELARQVRERRPDVKVLLMSGYAADALEKAGHRSAELDLLTKPFKRSVVARRILGLLRENF